MAIKFSCECGQRFTAKNEHAGRQSRCPVCGRSVTIPSEAQPERKESISLKISTILYCYECRGKVDRPPGCPHCTKKKGHARFTYIGPLGQVWINNSDRVIYQMIPSFHKGSGACVQYSTCLGAWWPIPVCHGCDCRQIAIEPGGQSLPFVDYLEEIRKLSLDQKYAVIGKGNWELLEAGLVTWSDVVIRYRVREFHEVMVHKKLTIPQMVKAGIPEEDAKAAWEMVYTPERLAADAKRREAIQKLKDHGLSTEDISRMVSIRIAGRNTPPKGAK